MSTILRLALALALLLLVASPTRALTYTVWPDGRGTFSTIQKAVDLAIADTEIILQPGTFKGAGNCNVDLKGKVVTIRSTNPSSPAIVAATIIDCGGNPSNHLANDCRRAFLLVTHETIATVLSGITIINGQTVNTMHYGGSSNPDDGNGGAILCKNASATIRNCVFRNCGGSYGAAVYNYGGQLLLDGCTFTQCWPFSEYGWAPGASVNCSNSTIRNCTFAGSDIGVAGTSTITNCSVTGGIGVECYGNTTISNCTISGNSSTSMNTRSSGLQCYGGTSMISNCVIDGNTTSGGYESWCLDAYGAGVSCSGNVTILNSRITRNSATAYAGLSSCTGVSASGSISLIGCTIADNSAEFSSGIAASGSSSNLTSVNLRNCIVWNNGATPLAIGSYASLTAVYSDIQGGLDGTGNISADPLFTATFHLGEESPCVNRGDPAYVPAAGETDLDGDPRILYGVVDMGSDEHVAMCDINGDGSIDVVDLLTFVDAWGSVTGDASYHPGCDFNHDGSVDVVDLLIFLDYFNPRIPPMP